MKVSIGSKLALYPMPIGIIGSRVDGRNNYALVAHFGIVSHSHLLVSLRRDHFSNKGIRQNKALTINLVDEGLLPLADFCGSISGAVADKSALFRSHEGSVPAPILDDSPLTIECTVDDILEIDGFDNFLCRIVDTHVDERVLTPDGKDIDYERLKPILFEFPTDSYLQTGSLLGKALSFHKRTEPDGISAPEGRNRR